MVPFIPGVAVVLDDVLVDVGRLVDSGPPYRTSDSSYDIHKKISYQLFGRLLH